MTSGDAFFRGSQIYDPVARLRLSDEILYIARVGMKASQRFMILTPIGEPAWPHEPLGSLSNVAWALLEHTRGTSRLLSPAARVLSKPRRWRCF